MILPLLLTLAQAPAAAPTPAPTPAPNMPPPAFMTAAQAFGQCISRGASAVPATTAPATGAQQVVAGCTAERTALDQQFEGWISGPSFPAAGRDAARAQYQQRMAAVPSQIGAALAQRTPTPGATPTPTPQR